MKTITLGTRGSQLALWQANHISDLILQHVIDIEVKIQVIHTSGDMIQDKPLPELGSKGIFTQELEDALFNEQIDIAVHSLKDLPSSLPDGLIYAGSSKRADCRDAFISPTDLPFEDLPDGARIATGSMRRKAQILEQNPKISCGPLRGNIQTRLRKLKEENWDGIFMAAAALNRLGLKEYHPQLLDPEIFVPAVGQGAVGLEIKQSRLDIQEILNQIIDPDTVTTVTAERAFMRTLEGGCSIPIGAWGRLESDALILTGYFASTDGQRVLRKTLKGSADAPDKLGIQLAHIFKADGVDSLIDR
ncbi:MAG: hydroxymethylbilane synthase [Candidatus Marinimicrobia bacterium]|nr:hydroxymethylbilane synthase [Candidatus Neomarinimicrobiota bacterium]